MIRSQIPKFRLPEEVIDEEVGYITDLGPEMRLGQRVDSLKALLTEGYDAIFVGSGAPRGRDLDLPGRQGSRREHPYRHRLAVVGFVRPHQQDRPAGHRAGGRQHGDGLLPLVAPAGRRRREGDRPLRLRGNEGLALGKRGRDREDIPILNYLVPKEFKHDNGQLYGMTFEKVKAEYDARAAASWCRPASRTCSSSATTCWSRSARKTPFRGSSATSASTFNEWDMPVVDETTFQSTEPRVFFGGDSAFGPKNIIWAVAHGHQAAISIHQFCQGDDVNDRPPPMVTLASQKMGIHEWSYDNDVSLDLRFKVPHRDKAIALKDIKAEVELGFDAEAGLRRGAALPELRRADGVHATNCASSATPASISARWIASPSPTNGDGSRIAHAAERAGAQSGAGAVRVRTR